MAGAEIFSAESLLAGLEDAVIAVDRAGSVTYANVAAATLFGADVFREPALWSALLARNRWLQSGLDEALDGARSHVRHQMELQLIGTAVKVGFRATPLFGEEGGLEGAVCSFSDQSSLVLLTENVRRVDRLEELGTLAAGLAHEIKNPLGGILGSAQLLRAECATDEAAECVAVIERDVRRINRLLEGLLDFGNEKPLDRRPVNLHRIIDDVVESLGRDPLALGHRVQGDFDPSLPDLALDADAIHQVILNLLKNALEASPADAPVVVKTRVEIVGRRMSKRAVLVEVTNEGNRLSDETRDKLFTPFYSTKKGGTGLGLLVSLRIVREHGGTIDVASDRGKTTFTVVLPMG